MSDEDIVVDFSDKAHFIKELYEAKKKNNTIKVYKLRVGKRTVRESINANRVHMTSTCCFDIPDIGIENFIPNNFEVWQNSYLLTDDREPDLGIAFAFSEGLVDIYKNQNKRKAKDYKTRN